VRFAAEFLDRFTDYSPDHAFATCHDGGFSGE
jgi:hypothetical protein